MFDRIKNAAENLRHRAHVTPIATSSTLNHLSGASVFFKCENLQRIGAFKFRGAYNAISRLSDEEKKRGIVTFSSGNHAQAVALVGRILGVRTTVVMPDNAPSIKRTATQGYGAEVIDYATEETSREVIAEQLQREHGYTLIPPYDHLDVIAGQGTAALELMAQAEEQKK